MGGGFGGRPLKDALVLRRLKPVATNLEKSERNSAGSLALL